MKLEVGATSAARLHWGRPHCISSNYCQGFGALLLLGDKDRTSNYDSRHSAPSADISLVEINASMIDSASVPKPREGQTDTHDQARSDQTPEC